MKQQTVAVNSGMGLHARPAAMLIKEASRFNSRITLVKGDREVDAKSMLGILTLAVKQGESVTLTASGEDENEAIQSLINLVNGLE